MTDVLLTSEAFIKENFEISDNVSGKFIKPSIREAQRAFRDVVGEALYNKIINLVQTNGINLSTNADYKTLLDRAQDYIAYTAIVELIGKVTYKIGNFGLAKSSDENMQVADALEVEKQQFYFQSKADSHCADLQNYLLDNRSKYPELSDNHLHTIKSNLYSAASCGIMLSGARGKIVRR